MSEAAALEATIRAYTLCVIMRYNSVLRAVAGLSPEQFVSFATAHLCGCQDQQQQQSGKACWMPPIAVVPLPCWPALDTWHWHRGAAYKYDVMQL